MDRTFWNFYSAGRVVFGSGAVASLPRLIEPFRAQRIGLLSDPVLERAGVVEQVLAPLRAAGLRVDVCLAGEPEPSLAAVDRALADFRDQRPDVLIGVGGGSNLDLAKAVAVLLTHGGTPRDYFGYGKVPGPTLPHIAIPTTSGTGSEVSHAAVLTDTTQHIKVSTLSQHLRPALAVVDPRLTLSCPPKPTADSGIDALTHAIEGFTSTPYNQLDVPAAEPFPYDGKNPIADMCAERAVELIGRHLVTTVKEPQNLAAREGMSLAATLAGLAFSNSAVAAVHALEYPLGGLVHVSHGAGNGLLLPYVMRFNLPVRKHEFAQIARLLGEDTTGLTETVAAERAITAVERLRSAIGIPSRLRELSVKPEQLPELAQKAHAITRLMLLNARRPSVDDLLNILREAY